MDALIENLAEFFTLLRSSGLNISISDCLTAVEALGHIDITNREQVGTSFRACLAKSPQEAEILSKAFNLFFVPAESRREYVEGKAGLLEKKKQEIRDAAANLRFQNIPVELSDREMEFFAALPPEERKSLEDYLAATSAGTNVRAEFRQLAETMVKSRLAGLKRKYAGQPAATAGLLSSDSSPAGILAGEVRGSISAQNDLLYRKISEIGDENIPAVIRLISMLVEKLKRELTARYKKTGRITRLDFKRTVRSNLSTGRALFRLKYKSRAHSRIRLLLLCDVSASMLRFSGFVLNFMSGMNSCFSSMQSFIFSEDPEKINILSHHSLSELETRIRQGKIWGRGTNIGNALGNILKDRMVPISSSTVLVIVSDARTVDPGSTENRLKELSEKIKRIFWLNPEEEGQWESIKGLEGFRKYCRMFDCSTLERLANACRDLS